MLVLSRKSGESLVVDDNIRVTILEICGDRVRVGIEAPREVPVHRHEVHRAMLERSVWRKKLAAKNSLTAKGF
ncbi:MAG: carbon storage regulator CsrA [Planctomycetota bacterium]|nr:carbon storage regulator CsrA [Planctomycetota bacterium]MDA1178039.1 carbon storage regulator CsrA [Planctomycetota bacterium]